MPRSNRHVYIAIVTSRVVLIAIAVMLGIERAVNKRG